MTNYWKGKGKIWDSEPDTAYRMNEGDWFKYNQTLLVWMANHPEGRKLLALDSCALLRIDEIRKNSVSVCNYEQVDKNVWTRRTTTDFRVGAKWANVIRYRWDWFLDLSREYAWYMDRGRLPWNEIAGVLVHPGPSLTVYPDPDPETTTVDGYVGRAGVDETWGTLRTGAGNGNGESDTGGPCHRFQGSATSNQFQDIYRAIYLFDTNSIADSDTIDSAIFSLHGTNKTDNQTNTPNLNLYASTPASNTALANADFGQVGSTAFATAVTWANQNTGAYTDLTVNATGLLDISKTGVTKFGTRNANYDVDNVAPTWGSGGFGTYNIKNADTAGTGTDPKLVVESTAEVSYYNRRTMLGIG